MADAFGVELPDNLGESTAGTEAPESKSLSNISESTSTPEAPKAPLDLDKLEKVLFQGKEWTPKELKSSLMAHQDYTRKTIELSENRKFVDNFEIDLEKVQRDPSLMAQFKAVYPKLYVDAAQKILGTRSTDAPSTVTPTEAKNTDPEVANMMKKFSDWEKSQEEAETTKIQSWLDNQFKALEAKYPIVTSALQEIVSARARYLSDSGTEINEKVLDKLFKQVSDEITPAWENMYKTKVTKQLEAGQKGKDVGSGGAPSGGAPKGPKTMKEAKAALMAQYD